MNSGRDRARAYNTEERAIIDVRKAAYLQATSPPERKLIAQEVLADLFTHWSEKGLVCTSVERAIRTKALVGWLQNNWRCHRKSGKKVPGIKMKKTEVLWKTRQEEVFAEIAMLLGTDSANASTPGWFNQRMPALGNILSRMTTAEKDELEKERQRLDLEGNREEDKRRLAEKSSGGRLDQAARKNWLDMGLLSVTFYAHTTSSGQLSVEVHDRVADILGAPSHTFEQKHEHQVTEMKRLMHLYIKGIRDMLNPGNGLNGPQSAPTSKNPNLLIAPGGYPMVPTSLNLAGCSKKQLERLMRKYLSDHYRLAAQGRQTQTPYKALKENLSRYVDPEHLPAGMCLADPRSMKADEIRSFFDHIIERQQIVEPANVFRFKTVKRTRKGTRTLEDIEDNDDTNSGAQSMDSPGVGANITRPQPRPKPRSKKDNNRHHTGAALHPAIGTDHTGPFQNTIPDHLIDPLLLAENAASQQAPDPIVGAEITRARPRPNPKSRNNNNNLNTGADNTTPDHVIDPLLLAENAASQQAPDPIVGAEITRARPRPNPKSKKNNNNLNSGADLPLADPGPSMPTIASTSRRSNNTADTLALQEAQRYMTYGKRSRVPRTRQQSN